ncbi:MAG: DNA alkylation repair protein [Candidatus Beckwithbacteria bacterium]
MNQIISDVKKELIKKTDPKYRDGEKRFFKEKIKNFGVRLANRRQVAAKLWPEVKKLNKQQVFNLAEMMFKAGYNEYATIASSWIWRRREEFEAKDFKVFKICIDKYFNNWAKIDDFCTHSLGYLINQYPKLAEQLFSFTKSSNRWVKRAAAVSLIYPFGKKKKYLKQIIKTAKALLIDTDDMVQKGYGWMLKEASKYNQKEVFEFIMKHKNKMPRTALRYAIEKMPGRLRIKAMA